MATRAKVFAEWRQRVRAGQQVVHQRLEKLCTSWRDGMPGASVVKRWSTIGCVSIIEAGDDMLRELMYHRYVRKA